MWSIAGSLAVLPVAEHGELLAEPVIKGLQVFGPEDIARCAVAEIDPELADTAAFCERYGSPLAASANCVVVAGKRGGELRYAGCLVLATSRADVNGAVRRRLDVRKASFAPMDEAVRLTGMEYGGITPIGLPAQWPLLIDRAVAEAAEVVIGSGMRRSKLLVPGDLLTRLPNAEVIDALGR